MITTMENALILKFGTKPLRMRAYSKSRNRMLPAGSLERWFQTCADTGVNPIENRKIAGDPLIYMLYIAPDRDGKDMFEGDIIEVEYKTELGVILLKGFMEWNPETLSFGSNILTKLDGMPSRIMNHSSLPRVIGDIFTTPELLKEFAK
jgi:hypothetical protein